MMKSIFKKNALIAISYTVFFVGISFLFNEMWQSIILGFVYSFVACIHFMIMGVSMAIYHFKEITNKRNGYMVSFGFIWFLVLLVNTARFLL